MEPTYATAISFHQSRLVKNKRASADPDNRHIGVGRALKIRNVVRIEFFDSRDQSPDDDDIVEFLWITETFIWLHGYSAAGHNRIHRRGHNAP